MAEAQHATIERLARELHKNELIKFGAFKLKSGIISPFYIDLRQAQSFPSTLKAVADTFAEMLRDVDDRVALAGVPEAGTPLATAVGFQTQRRLLQPRKVVKDHGTKSSVEGAFEPGDQVILIDDLITKGDSKVEAIKQVESAGLVVQELLVLIDREQGGLETVRNAEYPIRAAMTISTLLEILLTDGSLSQSHYDEMMDFVRNN